MPNYSKEWTENTLVISENVLLTFNKRDAKLVRNWARPNKQNDNFAGATPATITLPSV